MAEYAWLVPWFASGFPLLSFVAQRRLSARSRLDYAYYLERLAFPLQKISLAKLSSAVVAGICLSALGVGGNGMAMAILVFAVSAALIESTFLMGRSHPTPSYLPTERVCDACSKGENERCTNVRMLDDFGSGFRSSSGRYRPVCCCGFRLSEWRELGLRE